MAALDERLHRLRARDSGFRADTPSQAWHTDFDERGFSTSPREGGWSWGLELESLGFLGREVRSRGRSARRPKGDATHAAGAPRWSSGT